MTALDSQTGFEEIRIGMAGIEVLAKRNWDRYRHQMREVYSRLDNGLTDNIAAMPMRVLMQQAVVRLEIEWRYLPQADRYVLMRQALSDLLACQNASRAIGNTPMSIAMSGHSV